MSSFHLKAKRRQVNIALVFVNSSAKVALYNPAIIVELFVGMQGMDRDTSKVIADRVFQRIL